MHPTKKPRTIDVGGITIVEFGEEFETLGEDMIPTVSAAVEAAGEAVVPKVLIDLTCVKYFGSSFIEVLYRMWKRMESRGGRFVICGLHPYCREVLQVTNLDKLWTISPDRESGMAVLRAEPVQS